jgi:U3 small nucleolar RNA-associated protein 25
MKLYESFGQADLIVASPLGLKLHLEQQTHLAFLSSVEIVILDDAVQSYNQNWAHVQAIFE